MARFQRPPLLVTAVASLVAAVLVGISLASLSAQAVTGSAITSKASGRCLDVIGEATAVSTGVNIYDCHATPTRPGA